MKRLVVGLAASLVLAQGGAFAMSLPIGQAAMRAARLAAPKPPETAEDVLRVAAYLQRHRMELFDQNSDGVLSFDEWLEYHFTYVSTYNVKGDGRILLEEFAQSINGPEAHPFSTMRPWHEIERLFRKFDRAGKGYLTIEDYREDAMRSFRINDVNRDGSVTEAEINEVATRNRRR
jgi:Ca2+-binding EF-hand superfamily protein